MAAAKEGDKVKVHYTGKLKDGQVFDTSRERDPMEFTVGKGEVIPGFDAMLPGMSPGETKSSDVSSEQAYGNYRPDMIAEVERDKLPKDLDLKVGEKLQLKQPQGPPMIVIVSGLSEKTVTLDGNHPLAGKDLTFEVELLEIV
jgi:FKBP-type peptidyl-prolyl cis-trans isomerase 2